MLRACSEWRSLVLVCGGSRCIYRTGLGSVVPVGFCGGVFVLRRRFLLRQSCVTGMRLTGSSTALLAER